VDLDGGVVRKITDFDQGVTSFSYEDKSELAGALQGVACANGLKLVREDDAQNRLAAVSVGNVRRVRLSYDMKGRIVSYALEPFGR
jgi:YD repeat-containing protein